MNSKPRWLLLSLSLAAAWAYYVFMLVRQIRLFDIVDPTSDTGVSFGYTLLVRFWGPALFVVTLVAIAVVLFVNARYRRRLNLKHPQQTASK